MDASTLAFLQGAFPNSSNSQRNQIRAFFSRADPNCVLQVRGCRRGAAAPEGASLILRTQRRAAGRQPRSVMPQLTALPNTLPSLPTSPTPDPTPDRLHHPVLWLLPALLDVRRHPRLLPPHMPHPHVRGDAHLRAPRAPLRPPDCPDCATPGLPCARAARPPGCRFRASARAPAGMAARGSRPRAAPAAAPPAVRAAAGMARRGRAPGARAA
jgi:hypothetical protein